jgi:hypothetical protein
MVRTQLPPMPWGAHTVLRGPQTDDTGEFCCPPCTADTPGGCKDCPGSLGAFKRP